MKTNLKIKQGEATSRKLLRIARNEFKRKGYAKTTTEAILRKANVTKGALYHHFPSKCDLFEAVYRDVEEEMAERISMASTSAVKPFDRLLAGCYAYFDACADSDLHRILRLDGPTALGQAKWQEIDREFGVEKLLPFLRELHRQGVIRVTSVEAFAYLLTGAMNEATFWIAQHPNKALALKQSKTTLRELLSAVHQQS